MREVKFRAWIGHAMIQVIKLDLTKNTRDEYENLGIGYFLDGPNEGRPTSFDANKDKVMQYTGLKDKNGKEIYEGDIVKGGELYATGGFKIDNSSGAMVVFKDGMFKCGKISLVSVYKRGEIIGNIYENPELLEGE